MFRPPCLSASVPQLRWLNCFIAGAILCLSVIVSVRADSGEADLNAASTTAVEFVSAQSIVAALDGLGQQITALQSALDSRTRALEKRIENVYLQLESLQTILASLPPLEAPLPSFRLWRISPDFGRTLVTTVLMRQPAVVLEFGSGVSTLLAAYALKKIGAGGRVISVDHNLQFAEITRRDVLLHGLQSIVEVVHIPLAPMSVGEPQIEWYNQTQFEALLTRIGSGAVGVLVVDGPPAQCPQGDCSSDYTRYPALPLSLPVLRADAAVLMDDARRESHVLSAWLQHTCCFVWDVNDQTEKGVGVLFRHALAETGNVQVPGWLY